MTVRSTATKSARSSRSPRIVGTILAVLIGGLMVYLLVRPPRHVRERKAERRASWRRER